MCQGVCSPAEWKCASGECIAEIERCDNVIHCADGSDESGCGNYVLTIDEKCSCGPLGLVPLRVIFLKKKRKKIYIYVSVVSKSNSFNLIDTSFELGSDK